MRLRSVFKGEGSVDHNVDRAGFGSGKEIVDGTMH